MTKHKALDFGIDQELMKSSPGQRISAVKDLAHVLDVGNLIEISQMHKASKSESIDEPHENPVIWELEKQFFALWDPKTIIKEILTGIGIGSKYFKSLHFDLLKAKKYQLYKADGQPLNDAEVERLEKIIQKALKVDMATVRKLIVRSAAAGKLAEGTLMGTGLPINLSKLPKTLKDAIKTLKLTQREVRSIQWAFEHAATNITAVTERARLKIKRTVLEGIQTRTSPKVLANKLYNEVALDPRSVMNRDWERVAITEMNRSSNDAFLSAMDEGEYVLGNSHDDACPHCKRLIDLKIYKVTHDPPSFYGDLDPKSKEYKDLAERWENEVWIGKTNVGRSTSPRKQTEGGLVDREHSELSMPVLPLHPHCRCRWSRWIPDLYYLKAGRVAYATDAETKLEQADWLKRNPLYNIGKAA